MRLEYQKALQEVKLIINQLEKEDYEKIPDGFIKMMEKQRDKRYKPSIEWNIPLTEQPLLEETKAILAVLYKMYLNR